ncbi:MAG: uracil-DNA glycosylase family protein [Chloroflexota bacterium]
MTDSFTQLHIDMRACRRCLQAGHAITPGAVFSSGREQRVLLIGQAPGVTEVTAGRPFNATSGTRLFKWLGEAGWAEDDFRARHTMTAVTKCYPGKDKSGKGDRVPSKAEQALCRPFLEREIALIDPRLIILVGGLAIKLLYPAQAKLREVIGTAVYFPPDVLTNPVNFNFHDGQLLHSDSLASLISPSLSGRLVVPLPHPSGASLWPNKPANKALLDQAVSLLQTVRLAWEL